MRLKIKEYISEHNERNGTRMKMQDLADIVYADKAWTKQNRIVTGKHIFTYSYIL